MFVSAKELRFKISMLFDIIDKKEDIIITYRGKPKAKLTTLDSTNKNEKDQLFGLWKDKEVDVDAHIRSLREGRKFL